MHVEQLVAVDLIALLINHQYPSPSPSRAYPVSTLGQHLLTQGGQISGRADLVMIISGRPGSRDQGDVCTQLAWKNTFGRDL